MIRHSDFKFPYQFFHFNFEYQPTGYFKSLDWDSLCIHLNVLCGQLKIEIHALVMMDTHVHILFRTSDSKENFFASEITKKLNTVPVDDNNVEPIRHQTQYMNTYRYIYRNPVVAEVTHRCEDYPYSSLSGLLGKSTLKTSVFDQMGLIQNPVKIVNWLNSSNTNLRHATFNKNKISIAALSKI